MNICDSLRETNTYLELKEKIESGRLHMRKMDIIRCANSEDVGTRQLIATHPDLPEHLKWKLSNDKYYLVRRVMAERPDLPEDLKYRLGNSKDSTIRRRIARFSNNLPKNLLYKMAEDEQFFVREVINQRHDLPEDLIIRLNCDIDYVIENENVFKLNNFKEKDLEDAYDLILNSKYIGRENFEKTFDYIANKFPELSKLAKMFKRIILKGKKDLK